MKYSGFQLPTTMKPENEVSESFCDEIFESSGVTGIRCYSTFFYGLLRDGQTGTAIKGGIVGIYTPHTLESQYHCVPKEGSLYEQGGKVRILAKVPFLRVYMKYTRKDNRGFY